jgi:hypothetical protein
LDDLAPADLSGDVDLFPRDAARIGIQFVGSGHSNQPRNTHDLARPRLPMPRPHERTRLGWRNLGSIDLQRQYSSHRDTFARILGSPHTEILFNPLWLEPEAQSLKRCFHRDLNISFLDL